MKVKGNDEMINLAKQEFLDNRLPEIINGEIVSMAPRPNMNHLGSMGNIYGLFYTYLKGKKCRVFADGGYIRLDKIKSMSLPDKNKRDRLVPDVMIVCDRDIIKSDGIYGAPDLVVEVLSPSTAKHDRSGKKDIYELIGVKEYWIVSTAERTIEVYLVKDGKYVLDNIYQQYTEEEIEMLMEDETVTNKSIVKEFKTSIFDDLVISTDDVFDKLI